MRPPTPINDAAQNDRYDPEMSWLIETIRASVFAPDIKELELSSWEALTGNTPRQTLNNPEIDGTVEAGSYRGHWLTTGVARRPGLELGRADLILTISQPYVEVPLADPLKSQLKPAAIGPFKDNFPNFVELAKRWFSTTSDVRRLALACRLWQGAASPEEALDMILQYVPSFKRRSNDRIFDFLIQLNRPCDSGVDPSISVNRLVQWSARTVEILLTTRPMFRPPKFNSSSPSGP
jgi:hypothetical protein